MVLKGLVWLVALLALAGLAWRHGGALSSLPAPDRARPVAIEFDNGTVRQPPVPASAAAPRPLPGPGGLRKCRRGAEVAYTQSACPPGMKEQALSGGTVNVVNGGAAQAGATAQLDPAPRPSTVFDALDNRDSGSLRDQRVERATAR